MTDEQFKYLTTLTRTLIDMGRQFKAQEQKIRDLAQICDPDMTDEQKAVYETLVRELTELAQ